MKRYSVAEARRRFADILDQADMGESVLIERRGRRYVLAADRPRARPKKRESWIEYMDPAVAAGQWTWVLTKRGLRFQSRLPRKRR